MNIYGAKQLANSFRTVRKNTIQVAEDIPESQYGYVAAEGTRSVAQTLSHLATLTPVWQDIHGVKKLTNMAEFDFLPIFAEMEAQENKKRSKAEIVGLLRTEGEKFATFLEGLSDEALAQEIIESPEAPKKSRLEVLMGVKEHEMHHRAQLMLIQRLLGIVPHLTKKYAEMEREYKEKQGQTAKQAAARPA